MCRTAVGGSAERFIKEARYSVSEESELVHRGGGCGRSGIFIFRDEYRRQALLRSDVNCRSMSRPLPEVLCGWILLKAIESAAPKE